MKKIVVFLMILVLAAMMATNSIAEESAPAEETTKDTNTGIMYKQGEAYAGILYTKSKQMTPAGARVIGDSGIGIKGGYFVSDNTDISLSYVFGTYTIGSLNATASEIHIMANYHHPFFKSSNFVFGGLIGLGYNSFNFQPTNAAGTALSGGGLIYEAGLDGRTNNIEGYVVYRIGPISYSTLNSSLTLNCVEAGINYIFDAPSWLTGSGE